MAIRSHAASRFRILAAIAFLPLLVLPGPVIAATQHQPVATAPLKALALRQSDVQHIFGSGLVIDANGSNQTSHDLTCANAPTLTFANSFSAGTGGSAAKKGLLSISAVLTQYKTPAVPKCNFKYDLFQRKTLGAGLGGVITTLHGVGDQAVFIQLDPIKHAPGTPVYALDARFIRGRYLVIIIVQMNRKVRPADVVSLAQGVDSRIKRSG